MLRSTMPQDNPDVETSGSEALDLILRGGSFEARSQTARSRAASPGIARLIKRSARTVELIARIPGGGAEGVSGCLGVCSEVFSRVL